MGLGLCGPTGGCRAPNSVRSVPHPVVKCVNAVGDAHLSKSLLCRVVDRHPSCGFIFAKPRSSNFHRRRVRDLGGICFAKRGGISRLPTCVATCSIYVGPRVIGSVASNGCPLGVSRCLTVNGPAITADARAVHRVFTGRARLTAAPRR